MEKFGRRILTTTIVCVMILSGLMVLPSNAVAKQGQPDLLLRSMSWRFPVMEGEDLPISIYVENVGDASVQTGFWLEVNYAEKSGFWQESTETHQIFVEPPIRAGEIKGVEFTTTAINSYEANFVAIVDTTNVIIELNENNNELHRCLIAVDGAPGSSISAPVYLRNEKSDITETFIVEVDESTIPSGWGFTGGLPPTTVTAAPGGNIVLSESAIVPTTTITNPIFKINATRQSDGASQSVFIKVLTTPEIGFSFNPYINEFSVWGVDELQQSDFETTSTIISENGQKTVEEFTVTNDRGQYVRATLEIHRGMNLHMYKILEIDYNGGAVITPEDNMFLTTFLVKNGELKHFFQYVKYGPETHSLNTYKLKDDITIMYAKDEGDKLKATFDGFEAQGVRIIDGELRSTRLDTTDPLKPLCPNTPCFGMGKGCYWSR